MDLAEIRKKAQQEQKGKNQIVEHSTTIPDEDHPGVDELTQAVAEPLSELFAEPLPDGTESAIRTSPEAIQGTFDPLALLIAGRDLSRTDEGAGEHAGKMSPATDEEFQEFLCFRVSSEIYAINIMEIKEIIKPREVTEIPRAPGFVSGVLSLRGIIIPIFNMRLRLGLAEGEKSGKERIIVVKRGEEFIGIFADEVTQVVRIASATIEKPPAVLDGIDRDFVSGIGRFNSQMLILLNQEKILDLSLG
jgi:purine-binding chemotaxis protein CheW